MIYKQNLGYHIGTFTSDQLMAGEEKIAIEKAKAETGLNYINTTFVKKKGLIVGMDIYVCDYKDLKFD